MLYHEAIGDSSDGPGSSGAAQIIRSSDGRGLLIGIHSGQIRDRSHFIALTRDGKSSLWNEMRRTVPVAQANPEHRFVTDDPETLERAIRALNWEPLPVEAPGGQRKDPSSKAA
jgi:hypothetical protein